MGTEIAQISDENIAKHFARSGFFKDITDESKAIVKIVIGKSLGFSAASSMMNIHLTTQGKLILGYTLIAGAIKASDKYDYHINVLDDSKCELEFFEKGKSVGIVSFTIDDAKRAGLLKNPVWLSYPSDMLFSKAIARGGRRYTADLFGGMAIYSEGDADELNAPEVNATPSKPLEQKIIEHKARLQDDVIETTGIVPKKNVEMVTFAGKEYVPDEVVGPDNWTKIVSPVVLSLNANEFEKNNSLAAHSFPRPASKATWSQVAIYTDYKLIRKSEPHATNFPDGLGNEDVYATWVNILEQAGLENATATLALSGVTTANIEKMKEPLSRVWEAISVKLVVPTRKQTITAIVQYLTAEVKK